MKRQTIRVAVDTGGTFTDCVWVEGGELRTLKVFSTPQDASVAIEQAVRQAVGEREFVLLHGTTVGTNALLERKGARVALVTTAGFEDVIEIGRQNRPKLYDFDVDRPEPLVKKSLRFGVRERVASDGSVVATLDEAEIARCVVSLEEVEFDSVAVSLLFSFIHPEHERLVANQLRNKGHLVSVSHEILPEFREYERTSTAVINAYLQPLMGRYLSRLAERLPKAKIFVMQSNGGIAPLQTVAREPVRTVLSGPAGGVVGALTMARRSGIERVIGFDMGGTSTDVALIDGVLRTTNEGEIIGLPIRVPMLEIHTVGAGGGSIARFDAGGALRVGPESAGADPGPICYGKGMLPTVTDANVLLGRLRPEAFLGGGFVLDVERTRDVVAEWLRAQKSEWTLEQFALGVVRVVNANMEKALRAVSIERGVDPRELTLVAFGGAGALHGCELAEALQIPRVLVPQAPGALSAYGILVSDVVKEFSRTVMLVASESSEARVAEALRELQERAVGEFAAEGWDFAKGILLPSLDCRYRGQGFELNVSWSGELVSSVQAFHFLHKQRYGYADEGRAVEVVNVRVRAVVPTEVEQVTTASYTRQEVHAEAGVFARENLRDGESVEGPAVVTEYSATTFVAEGWSGRVDVAGNLVLEQR